MTQATDFGFNEETTMLKDSARKFFQNNLPTDKLHHLVASESKLFREPKVNWDKEMWQQMVELGWTAVAVPEAAGGIGMPLVAVAALAEELGRACVPSPLITTLQATYVLSACETDSANKLLEKIAEGSTATLALSNQRGSWLHTDSDVKVDSEGALNGSTYYVQDAGKSDFIIVKANNNAGETGLFCIDISSQNNDDGVTVTQDSIVDLTRDQAHIEFNKVKAEVLVECGKGDLTLAKAEPAMLTIVAADMAGAGEWQLQTTTEYVSTRQQFDHPLAFFQAVKHPLVDLMVLIDRTRGLVYNAACAYDSQNNEEPDEAERCARMAKASACEVADFGSLKSTQLHGGIGFTWECFVHLYAKRQKHNQVLLGDASYQKEKLADIVLGSIAS